jgi:hypothetical protein
MGHGTADLHSGQDGGQGDGGSEFHFEMAGKVVEMKVLVMWIDQELNEGDSRLGEV